MLYDVAIVGAGPAGLFSAYELIEKNPSLKVVLLDKGKFAENISGSIKLLLTFLNP